MKLHLPSFFLGVAGTAFYHLARHRIRPVEVELLALLVHLGRVARGVLLRKVEDLEDFWAEVDLAARARARGGPRRKAGAEPAAD